MAGITRAALFIFCTKIANDTNQQLKSWNEATLYSSLF